MDNKIVMLCAFFFSLFLYSGCHLLSSTLVDVQLAPVEEETTLIRQVHRGRNSDFIKIGEGTTFTEFDREIKYYIIRQELDGHYPHHVILEHNSPNWPNHVNGFLGLGGIGGGLAVGLGGDWFTGGTLLAFGAVYGGTWLLSPKKTFGRFYELPPLLPLPVSTAEGKSVFVNEVRMSQNLDSVSFNTVLEFKNHESRSPRLSTSRVLANMEDRAIRNLLNYSLVTQGFLDTTEIEMFATQFNKAKLVVDVEAFEVDRVHNLFKLKNMVVNWSIVDIVSNRMQYERQLNYNSEEFYPFNNSEGSYTLAIAIADGLQKTMFEFLLDAEVQPHLRDIELEYTELHENWEVINLSLASEYVSSLSEATMASVSIQHNDKTGHGSGFVIADGGYIISNFHVTGAISDSLTVITNDGNTYSATLIRVNPLLDLALLKVNSPGFPKIKPIAIEALEAYELGDNVFAVGTPTDIKLGQTVTRGIVSGIRNYNDRRVIQTDVPISGGNSGGPLLNQNFEAIGVINAKLIGFGVEGVGFGIPADYIISSLKLNFN